MKSYFHSLLATCVLFAAAQTALADPPAGFDAETLKQVMSGKIVGEVKTDTANEYRLVNRAYFHKVSTDAFLDLAVDHAKYPSMFSPEVQDARTLTVNEDKTVYTYTMDLEVTMGLFTFYLHPEAKHTLKRAADPTAEAHLLNELTSHKEQVELLVQNTRLIPHESGILVEEDLHLKMKPGTVQGSSIKNYLKKFFARYVDTFRKELKGELP